MRSLHGDHLGNVHLATNASGTVVSRQEFDPWGQLRGGGISQTDINDTGQRLDGTGLLYYHARMDDPALARFVSADSIVPGVGALTLWPSDETAEKLWKQKPKDQHGKPIAPTSPQELNRYSYVANNPLNKTDPTGHCGSSNFFVTAWRMVSGGCWQRGRALLERGRNWKERGLGLAMMGLSVIGNASLIGAAYFGGAAIISAGAAASGAAVSAPYVTFGMRALQHAFSRGHAADFGITGNWSKVNPALFRQVLQSFVTPNNTRIIQGTYRETMQIYLFMIAQLDFGLQLISIATSSQHGNQVKPKFSIY